MWALGFLAVIFLYFSIIRLITRQLSADSARLFWLVSIGIPVSFPFWHFLYPSYHEFQKLCNSENRYVIAKTENVDFVYSDSGCHLGFSTINGKPFKGYECEHWEGLPPTTDYSRPKKYFRFTYGANWISSDCQKYCKSPSLIAWEKNCQATCFNATEISEPSFKYESTYESTPIIADRLIQTRHAKVNRAHEDMTVLLNYVYYPYGNGFAKILGLASGSAPTISCEKNFTIELNDFLKPAQ